MQVRVHGPDLFTNLHHPIHRDGAVDLAIAVHLQCPVLFSLVREVGLSFVMKGEVKRRLDMS
jgi:hypothetical protein